MTLTDEEALRRTAEGDDAAFEVILDRHEAAVLRFIRGLTGEEDRVEDALQETFIAAWRGASGFRGTGGSARAWLLSIARNAVRRSYRRRAGEPERHESLEALAVAGGWGREPPAVRRLEARELLERGLAALPPEFREVLILRELEGFSGPEAAELLGLSLAATKSRLHRARLGFVAALKEVDHGA